MEGDQSGCGEEDSDFSKSDLDMASEENDMLYDLNVIDNIEFGMDNNIVGQGEAVVLRGKMDEANTLDELEYPSSEGLMLECSSDKEDWVEAEIQLVENNCNVLVNEQVRQGLVAFCGVI
ncbi:Hypothetical predicted protein [Olea europaea subsp. europaea]|uniref:Uncharacterized protein n=1 Tax=Olea europaea subsp. europaea TaxID=158383 RepID=A0A8S0UE66_OLEEU|nr:Hypothetical predicted protein [Olea europaea subsp. europaea]